jgi:hypothetical protein
MIMYLLFTKTNEMCDILVGGRPFDSAETIAPRTPARRIVARQRRLNRGVTLRAGGCDDYAACEDE